MFYIHIKYYFGDDEFDFEHEIGFEEASEYIYDTYGKEESIKKFVNDLDDVDLLLPFVEDNDDFTEWAHEYFLDEAKEAYEDAELYNNNIDMYYGV